MSSYEVQFEWRPGFQGCSDCPARVYHERLDDPGRTGKLSLVVHDATCPWAARLLPDRTPIQFECGDRMVGHVFADALPDTARWLE